MISRKLEKLNLWLLKSNLRKEAFFVKKMAIAEATTFHDEGLVSGKWGSSASGLLITDGDRVLLLKRSDSVRDPGLWGIPGGAIPVNDEGVSKDAEESALQETREEIGIVPSGNIIGSTEHNNNSFVYTTFYLKVSAEELSSISPVLNWEHTDWRVVSFDQLKELDVHPGVIRAIMHFRADKDSKNSVSINFNLPKYIFHGSKTPPKKMINVFLTKSFKSNKTYFGDGLYGIHGLSDSSKTMSGLYGNYIYKLKISPQNFLVLDKDIIGPRFEEAVLTQLEEKFGEKVYSDKELSLKIDDSSNNTLSLWQYIKEEYPVYNKFSGVFAVGEKYGKLSLVFDPAAATLISFDSRESVGESWTAIDIPQDLSSEDNKYVAEQYANYYPILFFEEDFDDEFSDLKDFAIKNIIDKDYKKFFDLNLYKRRSVDSTDPLIQAAAKRLAEEDPMYFLDNSLGQHFVRLEFLAAKKIKELHPELLDQRYRYLAQTYRNFL